MDVRFENKEGKEDWITPPNIVEALGVFDLDPCASKYQLKKYAKKEYTILDNGLSKEWRGRVWCNPPYNLKGKFFIKKLAEHNNGIGLIFTRTDTKVWHDIIFPTAKAVFFFKRRLRFIKGSEEGLTLGRDAGAPSCLVIYGDDNLKAVREADFDGYLVTLR